MKPKIPVTDPRHPLYLTLIALEIQAEHLHEIRMMQIRAGIVPPCPCYTMPLFLAVLAPTQEPRYSR